MAKKQYLDLTGLTTYDEEIKSHINEVASKKANTSDLTSHTSNKSNPHDVTAAQTGALPTAGGTMTGILYTTASTPLFIGKNGKVGMRAATSEKSNVGQINISNAWYDNGNQWGNQMSAYNGEVNAYNEFRVSHDGLEYNCQDGNTYQVLHEGNIDGYAAPVEHSHTASEVGADAAGSASSALASAKSYADSAAATAANKVKNDLLNGAGTAYDTLKELGDLIDDNTNAIDALETVAGNKADKTHTHAIGDVTNLQSSLDSKQATITGGATTITGSNLTANRALISNGSGKVAVSDITNTELGYLDGVTSNVQTQLNAKAASSTLTSHTGNKSNPHGVTAAQVGTYTKSEIDTALAGKQAAGSYAASSHTHDDRYYTESEIDSKITTLNSKIDKKMGDFTIEIYNGTGGNPKPVRFASFNYSTCHSEEGIAAKISLVSGHGNGSAYAFLEDAIIKVNYLGQVEVDNFKYYGQSCGTYDGESRQYGDIFWLMDETNKIVDFYVLMGQYARVNQTPWKRLTYSSKGTVTQHTSCTVYSTGTKNWANNNEIATLADIPDAVNLDGYAKKATTLSGYGITDAYTKTEIDTTVSSLSSAIGGKAASSHTHDDKYDAKGSSNTALTNAKSYTDSQIANLINASDDGVLNSITELADAIEENDTAIEALNSIAASKASASDLTSHTGNTSNPHGVTKAQVGLGNVENKSSATIRGELTKSNVTTALGYTPPTSNTTYGVVSTTADGLAPKRDGSTTKYLRADGTWATPPDNNTTYSNMTGASSSAAGKSGLVPAPAAGKQASFLRGDGTWATPPDTDTTYGVFSTTANGLAPKSDGSTTKYLRADGTWVVPPDNNTVYTHPTSSGNKHIPSGGSSGQILRWSADGTAVWGADNNTTYSVVSTTADGLAPKRDGSTTKYLRADGTWAVPPDNNTTYSAATTSTAGLMSAADKTKLDGIATGANNYTYTLPAATSSALGGVKIGSNITVSSGTISLTKSNVTTALGYTPPTSDTNTTYTFATGDSNGQIKVTPSGGSAQNISVKGLGSAAYTASTNYVNISSAQTVSGVKTFSNGIKIGNATLSYSSTDEALVISIA